MINFLAVTVAVAGLLVLIFLAYRAFRAAKNAANDLEHALESARTRDRLMGTDIDWIPPGERKQGG